MDEAHRMRRKLMQNRIYEQPDYNNLMRFVIDISPKTKSLLLATATPVQMHPIEAWDLLFALSKGNDFVLGNEWSPWRQQPETTIKIVSGEEGLPEDNEWDWIRNPFPFSDENRDANLLRKNTFNKTDGVSVISGNDYEKITGVSETRYRNLKGVFVREYNPFIRYIIRRTRKYLEETINQATGESYLKKIKVELYGEKEEDALKMPHYFQVAYENADEFCKLLQARIKGGGFFKTMLLKRLGSSIYAGYKTVEKFLKRDAELEDEENEISDNEIDFFNFSSQELEKLRICMEALKQNIDEDPKYNEISRYLFEMDWFSHGCIIFSQYYDTAFWFAQKISKEKLSDKKVGFYVGGNKSGFFVDGKLEILSRDIIKEMVRKNEIKLLFGTDAASEGLNLQRLGTLINLDLPWNPTRLEQRKGRIQRIGQARDFVEILNLRYKDSIEDKVHDMLAERLKDIYDIFGQIPDVLEDVWINVVYGEIEKAKQLINEVKNTHPFDDKYNRIEDIDWESCEKVLSKNDINEVFKIGW